MQAFLNDEKIKEEYAPHIAAKESVETASRYFLKRGWLVYNKKHVCARGSDLTISKNSMALTVEVKTAAFSKRIWRISVVKKKRRNDDLIAIVYPGGKVLVQPMKDHLKLCMASGMRSVGLYEEWL